jgi:HAD superfamily hydrolase (TIGR01459 family)
MDSRLRGNGGIYQRECGLASAAVFAVVSKPICPYQLGMMKQSPHFQFLAEQYDAFLLDLWGVVHDGTSLYAGARECLQHLYDLKKQVVLISNAPRRASKAQAVLDSLGVGREYYQHIITSGEVAFHALSSPAHLHFRGNEHYYFIGPDRDADVLHGLNYQRAARVNESDFLLNVGFGSEQDTVADMREVLMEAKARRLTMLCLNPDMEVVKITGEVFECAGVIAKQYQEIGGEVVWFGKPYAAIYEHAHTLMGYIEKSKILAVGDGLHTDIEGANAFGVDSLLIAGGILKGKLPDDLPIKNTPTYVAPTWRW